MKHMKMKQKSLNVTTKNIAKHMRTVYALHTYVFCSSHISNNSELNVYN